MKRYWTFFGALGGLCLILIAMQVVISSRTNRDALISSDLGVLRQSIDDYATKNQRLPDDLAGLSGLCDSKGYTSNQGFFGISFGNSANDTCVQNRLNNYHYDKKTSSSFELCATFITKAGDSATQTPANSVYSYSDFSVHNKGYQCFTNTSTSLSLKNSSSNYTAPAITTDPNLKMCSVTYVAVDPRQVISAFDVPGGSLTFTTTATYNQVTTPGAAPVQREQSIANVRRWNVEPKVYDSNCKKLAIADLRVGDRVSIYFDATAKTFVTAIQRLN